MATHLGEELARRDMTLVYGGGSVGLMGTIADAVIRKQGRVVGVIPEFLATKELKHEGLHETVVTPGMHERKAEMARRADAFIAMPGGLGTFEELFEILTWSQLGIHHKVVGLLNTRGFYDSLVKLIDHAIQEGFVPASNRQLFVVDEDPARLLDRMAAHTLPSGTRWKGEEAT
jgi:uncharacterized protein (TIGR00730 family)